MYTRKIRESRGCSSVCMWFEGWVGGKVHDMGLDGRKRQRWESVMNEWVAAGVWGSQGGREGEREKWEGGAVTSVSLWQMCILAWRRCDIKSLLIIFLFPGLTGVSVPGGFRSKRGADRCTPRSASIQDSRWCTLSSFLAILVFSLHPLSLRGISFTLASPGHVLLAGSLTLCSFYAIFSLYGSSHISLIYLVFYLISSFLSFCFCLPFLPSFPCFL